MDNPMTIIISIQLNLAIIANPKPVVPTGPEAARTTESSGFRLLMGQYRRRLYTRIVSATNDVHKDDSMAKTRKVEAIMEELW